MQAYRVGPRHQAPLRWLQHAIILLIAGSILAAFAQSRRPIPIAIIEADQPGFLAPPSAPAGDWRTARSVARPPVREPVAEPSQAADPADWVAARVWTQTRRATMLYSAPMTDSAVEVDVPAGRFARVLESDESWLRVGIGADEAGRPLHTGWIPTTDAGDKIARPRFVGTLAPTSIWSHEGPGAGVLAYAPPHSTLELAGPDRSGRAAVRLGEGARPGASIGWVDWDGVVLADEPDERYAPSGRAFAPFASIVRLDVPYRTQLDGSLSSASNCGPTSLAMALHAYGIVAPTSVVRSLAMRQMGWYDPFSGTTLESLKFAAEQYGLSALDLHENGRYRRWTLDDVRLHLRAGHPVIPELRYRMMPGREWFGVSYDHYVIITGMVGDDFIYNDPIALNGHGERVMSGDSLMRAWLNSDHPGAGFAIARRA